MGGWGGVLLQIAVVGMTPSSSKTPKFLKGGSEGCVLDFQTVHPAAEEITVWTMPRCLSPFFFQRDSLTT